MNISKLALSLLVLSTAVSAHAAPGSPISVIREADKLLSFSGNNAGYELSQMSREKLKGTTKTQGDFNLANRFSLEIDGMSVGGINSVEGLQHEHEIVEYKDGEDSVTHTRPGNHKPGKMTIIKDWSNTSEFYKWRKAVLDGKVERKSMSVIFHNDAGEEAGRAVLTDCFPTQYQQLIDPLNEKSTRQELIELECSDMAAKLPTTQK